MWHLESGRKLGEVEDGSYAGESPIYQAEKTELDPGQGGAMKGF